MTRIDVPPRDGRLQPGRQRIAGVAYAGDRGVQQVEFSADGGDTWQKADLIDSPTRPPAWPNRPARAAGTRSTSRVRPPVNPHGHGPHWHLGVVVQALAEGLLPR